MDQLDMSTYDDYHRRYYQTHKADIIRYNAEYKFLRRKNHLCVECGEQDAYTLRGRSRCAECVQRATARARERHGYKVLTAPQDRPQKPWKNWPRGANGYCWQCNKRPSMEGRRICRECYRMKVENIERINRRKAAID